MTTVLFILAFVIVEIILYAVAKGAGHGSTTQVICIILFFLLPLLMPFTQAFMDIYTRRAKIRSAIRQMDRWQKLFFWWGLVLFWFGQTHPSFPDTSFGASFFQTYAQPLASQIGVAFIFSAIVSFTTEYSKQSSSEN